MDKKILITGGAQRIGCSITKHLASKGYDVAIQYNTSKSDVNKLISLFKSSSVNFKAFQFDFKKAENYANETLSIDKKITKADLLISRSKKYSLNDNHIENMQIKLQNSDFSISYFHWCKAYFNGFSYP